MPEEVLKHPHIQVQVEGFGLIRPVEPYAGPVHIDRAVDLKQGQGVVEDHGIEGCLDTVADAEILACLDIDDGEGRILAEHDQVRPAGGEPMQIGVETITAQEVNRYRDGRLVDRLPGEEVREYRKGLLDGERSVRYRPDPLRDPHPPCQFCADNLLLPPDASLQEGTCRRALVHHGHRDAGSLALLLRGRVVAEVALAVVVEEPADERWTEVKAGHGTL